jgi:hypothetical protein
MTRRTAQLVLATIVALVLVAPVGAAAAKNGKSGGGNGHGKSAQAHAKSQADNADNADKANKADDADDAESDADKADKPQKADKTDKTDKADKADKKAMTQASTGTYTAMLSRGATTLTLTLPASTTALRPAQSTGSTVALPITNGRASVQLSGSGTATVTVLSLRHVGGLGRGTGADAVSIRNLVIADGKATAQVKGPGTASTRVVVATVGTMSATVAPAGKGTTLRATTSLTLTADGATALNALGFSVSAGTTVPITINTRVVGKFHR